MKKFTLNSKDYDLRPIDFNGICELEDLGLNIKEIKSQPLKSIRGLIAYHCNMTIEDAGKEFEKHIFNGGDIGDFTALIEDLGDAFFRLFPTKKEPQGVAESKN